MSERGRESERESESETPTRQPEPVVVIGSAWLGLINGPRSRLEILPNRLELSVPMLGQYRFAPEDVVAIDRGFGPGCRIEHIRRDVPARLSFRAHGFGRSPEEIIAEAGFVPTAKRSDAPAHEPIFDRRFVGLVVLTQLAFGVAVAWRSQAPLPNPDPLAMVWIVAALALAVVIRVDGPIRRFAIRSPLDFGRAVPVLNVMTLVLVVLAIEVLVSLFGW